MFIVYRKSAVVRAVLVALILAGIFDVQPAQAQALDFGWAQRMGGINLDYGTAIALDDSGYVYTSGFMIRNSGNYDAFLHKWDATGESLWVHGQARLSHEESHSVALDGEGNVHVVGAYSDTVEFDPGNSAGNLTSAGLTDFFIVKYDGEINLLWAKGVGGTLSDAGNGITVDDSGNVYVTGTYSDTVDFDPAEGVSTLTSAGNDDIFILKLDRDGDFIWAKSIGGPLQESSFDIAVDTSGNVFATGYFSDMADFDPGAGTSNLTSAGQGDVFIVKLDHHGNYVWGRKVGGTGFDSGIEVALDASGNVYTAGYFNDTASAGLTTLTSAGANDILISKLDNDGNFLWVKSMGGPSFDSGYGIAVDGNGNVYTTGEFSGTADFDPGAGISSLTSAGASDVFVSKLNSDGNYVWAKELGGTAADIGEGIVVQDNGSLYLVGAFSDTVDFDPGSGTRTLTSAGGLDIFVSKLTIAPQIHYVAWNASGANNGSSWGDAYINLQSALAAAVSGDEIWVAAGTYKPTSGTDRTVSFTLKNGVAVYGGFAGTETLRTQRNPTANATILSGDIGVVNVNSDNSYHVITSIEVNDGATLDGFIVTGGNANGSAPQDAGGGMLNAYSTNIKLANLTFSMNSALNGGGIQNWNSDVDLTNVTFSDNSAVIGGGVYNHAIFSEWVNVTFQGNSASYGAGMYSNGYSSPLLTDLVFNNNAASVDGGGMYNDQNSALLLTNVTFSNNSANRGGGMYNYHSSPGLTDVSFVSNSASAAGGGIANENSSSPTLTTVTLTGNTAEAGGAIYHQSGLLTITGSEFIENTASRGGAIACSGGTIAITDSTFHSNEASSVAGDGGAIFDCGSGSSIAQSTFSGNSASHHGGAIFTDSDTEPFTVTNSTFYGNSSPNGGGIANYGGLIVIHSTFSHNNSSSGGAIRNGLGGVLSLRNSILANSTGGVDCIKSDGTPAIENTSNLIETTGTGFESCGTSLLSSDPLLGALASNGGPTMTMAITSASPAFNAVQNCSSASTDQRGVSRPQGAACDLGAYELETSAVAPGAAILVSPSGSSGNNNPTYTWNQVSGAAWYYLWINGPSGNVIKQWYSAEQANCDGSTCSVTPNTSLSNGSHTWWIRTWNSSGYGPWSAGMNFTVSIPLPGEATLVSPSGGIGSNTPTYTWNEVSGSTWYYLWINGPSGNVFKKWYTSDQANCDGSTCSVIPDTTLSAGSYTWWIQTWSSAGYGPWSGGMSFSTPLPPGRATLVSPTGGINTNTPTYSWHQVSGATWYYLWVNGPSGNVIKQWYTAGQVSCNGSTCSVTPSTALTAGAHTWWIQTWNNAGYGPWSNGMNFSIP